jgi:endogenous inhibitor of DNA gyrase (YacG/DUF329 family)
MKLRARTLLDYSTPTVRVEFSESAHSLTVGLLPHFLMPKCPTCARLFERQDNPWRPFCSERCKLIDFGRWADEDYRVPGQQISRTDVSDQSESDETNEKEREN